MHAPNPADLDLFVGSDVIVDDAAALYGEHAALAYRSVVNRDLTPEEDTRLAVVRGLLDRIEWRAVFGDQPYPEPDA